MPQLTPPIKCAILPVILMEDFIMTEVAKKAVDVSAALTKWGIEGAGYVADCGIRLADAAKARL